MATYSIDEARSLILGYLDKVAAEAQAIMQDEIRTKTKEQSGRLEASINIQKISESARSIGTNVEYAKYVNDGRGEVRPKNAKFLRWESPRFSGNEIFAKRAGQAEGIHFTSETKKRLEGMHIPL